MLDEVLNTKKNINILDKQTTIEKILIEYELKYFKEYFGNNKIKLNLLHKNMKIFEIIIMYFFKEF